MLRLPVDLEVIFVDDGSTDRTREIAEAVAIRDTRVRIFSHTENRGKGAGIRTALGHARGDIVVIQDADLESDPEDLLRLLAKFEDPSVSVVYGSRWLERGSVGPGTRASRLAAWILSKLTNALFGSRLTDQPTAYKMFRRNVFSNWKLHSSGFAICAELTAGALQSGFEIEEVPISYAPRGRRDGKKIRWFHGAEAIAMLLFCYVLGRAKSPQRKIHAKTGKIGRKQEKGAT